MKKKLITRDDANAENMRRSDEMHDVIFPAMFTDLKSLKLKRINVVTGDRNNHKCEEIKEDSFYLVGDNGRWFISKPSRLNNNGWQFDVGWSHVYLGMVDFLFEIKNLTGYDGNPLGWVSADFDEYGDRIHDE